MSNASTQTEDVPLLERIRANPRPALVWTAGALLLLALEFGAIFQAIMAIPWDVLIGALPNFVKSIAAPFAAVGDALAGIPTLLTRDVVPNQGYQQPMGTWHDTFLGLEPAAAWFLRVVLVYAYAFAWLLWAWRGYNVFRDNYRYADWTPKDDMVDRLRDHSWGKFGLVIVFMFLILALFAPALGPTTVEQNIENPYSYNVQYLDPQTGSVSEVTAGAANLASGSQGNPDRNVGPLSYDQYGRYHPFGTLPSGKDLFTFMAAGARVSLFIGLVTMGLAGSIAVAFAMLSAYYKGLIDLVMVISSDSIQSLPIIMVLILMSVVMRGTWIAAIYNGALLLALILALTYWPILWRAIRGPSFQVSEQEWVDAARSFGQKPRVTMQKHMAPYVLGYLLVYTSMSLGGVIISVAGLSFLGLGISPPTPEWGRAINAGQQYVTTSSWHISLLPGIMIVLVVTAFNALGDGIRDAIDPQSQAAAGGDEEAGGAEVAAGGGGA